MGSPGEGPGLANLLFSKDRKMKPCSVVPEVRGLKRGYWEAREDFVVND